MTAQPTVETHEVPWWLPKPTRKDMPNAGDGAWEGEWPLDRHDPAPPPSVPVVYHLFDGDGLCYIGSTDDLRARLRAHSATKTFLRWTAQASRSRQDAYREEKVLIRRHKPRLNVTHVTEDEITWTKVKPRARERSVFCGRCGRFVPPGSWYSLGTGALSCEACTPVTPVSVTTGRVGSGRSGPGVREVPPTPRASVPSQAGPLPSPPGGVDLTTGELKPCTECKDTTGDCRCFDDPAFVLADGTRYDPSMEPESWR